MSKYIPSWLLFSRDEAHRLFKVADDLLNKIIEEGKEKNLSSYTQSEFYRDYEHAYKEYQEADKKWADDGKRWEKMTPEEQYDELKCEHPEEAQEVRPDVFLGESPVTQRDIVSDAVVCGICNAVLDERVPPAPESPYDNPESDDIADLRDQDIDDFGCK